MKLKLLTLSGFLASSIFASAQAYEAGDLILRAGPATVDPDVASSEIRLSNRGIPGTGVDVDDNTQLGLTATYMLTDNFGIGVLAATPFEHTVSDVGLGVGEIVDLKHLPPTVTFQYFPRASDARFQPYVGVGLNYTTFFDETATAGLNGALGTSTVELSDSVGPAAELGFDYAINDRWILNASAWLVDIATDARIDSPAGVVTVDVDIDPVVYMFGLGYKF